MWNFFKKFFKKEQFGYGWLGDEKEYLDERNYHTEEIFKSYPTPKWVEKKPSEWRRFEPIRNQNGSSSCVAFAIALALGVENYLEEGKFEKLSARFIYSRGYVEATGGGMYYLQALEIARKEGTCLEQQMPSDGLDENAMRKRDDETPNVRWTAQIYKANSYVFLPLDIDVWAGIIQSTNKVLLTGLRFNQGGFSKPEVILDKNGKYGHAVNIVDATLYNGKKALIFQHAWTNKWGINGLGIITEEQFKNGVILGAYLVDFKYEPQKTNKPKMIINARSLRVGDRGGDVIKLQIGLQWLGYFPIEQECTGFYGGLTRQAVRDFQKNYGLQVTGIADLNTIQKFNEIFGRN
jgi:hypothetical protein